MPASTHRKFSFSSLERCSEKDKKRKPVCGVAVQVVADGKETRARGGSWDEHALLVCKNNQKGKKNGKGTKSCWRRHEIDLCLEQAEKNIRRHHVMAQETREWWLREGLIDKRLGLKKHSGV